MARPQSAMSVQQEGGDGDAPEDNDNFLCLGDTVSLYSDDCNGFLGGNGFADIFVRLYHVMGDHKPTEFNECQFRLVPQHSYDSHKSLKKLKKKQAAKKAAAAEAARIEKKRKKVASKHGDDEDEETPGENENPEEEQEEDGAAPSGGGEDSESYTLNKMTEQYEAEIEANKAMVLDKSGMVISYGMVVQLQHVKSGKCICTKPKIVAEQERSCSAVELFDEGGTSGVFFKVESRFKFREQGAPVLRTDEIYLINPKVDQYLHIANNMLPNKPQLREVNASQALRSRFKVMTYSPYDENAAASLYAGDIVRLHHPESDLSLSAGDINPKTSKCEVRFKGSYGSDNIEKKSSMALWVIENEETSEGGPCQLSAMGVPLNFRFRNLATGKFLAGKLPDLNFVIDDEQETKPADDDDAAEEGVPQETGPQWQLVAEDSKREDSGLFSFQSESVGNSLSSTNAKVKVCHARSGRFVHAGEAVQDPYDAFEGAVSSCPSLGVEALDEHTLVLQKASEEEIKDLYFVMGTIPLLEAYVQRCDNIHNRNLKKYEADVAALNAPEAKPQMLDMGDLIGEAGSPAKLPPMPAPPPLPGTGGVGRIPPKAPLLGGSSGGSGSGSGSGLAVSSRAGAGRGAGIGAELTQEAFGGAAESVQKVREEMEKAQQSGSSKPSASDIADRHDLFTASETAIITKVLTELIFFVTKTNSDDPYTCEGLPNRNQQKLLREQHMGDLLARIIAAPFQGDRHKPYNLEFLHDPSNILDVTRLTYRLMRHLAKSYRRNEVYLSPHIDLWISQCCITGDDNDLYAEATLSGVISDNKQLLEEKIDITNIKLFVDLLLEQDKDARYVELLTSVCSCQGEAVASNQEALCELVLGTPSSLKELCIQTSIDKQGNPLMMFIDYNQGAAAPLQQFLIEGDSEMVDYYVALLGLFGEVCYERNYKGIYQIEALYKYEVVLQCMANVDLGYRLRSKFARLMLTLHIDREPQLVVKVPNYTRINTHTTPAMGAQSAGGDGHDFSDVKAFISRYFEEMAPCQNAWETEKNEMSLNVLDVAKFLTSAGFYTTAKDYRDLVAPLVFIMDGTRDQPCEPGSQPDPDNKLRYVQSEGTLPIMEAKVKMCEVLLMLSDIRLDSRITDLLRAWDGTRAAGFTDSDFAGIFQISDMDLTMLTDLDVVSVLLDLTLYKHDGLVDAAFANLTKHFTQKHELILASERVQLLTEPTLIDLHDRVIEDLQRLRSLVETEELWLGEDDPQDRAGVLMTVLCGLLSHCEAPPEVPSGIKKERRRSFTQMAHADLHEGVDGESGEIPAPPEANHGVVDILAAKELLCNVGAHRAVIEVLEIERLLMVDGGLDLLCVCQRFLQAFAQNTPSNIEELQEYKDLFLEQLANPDVTVVTAAAETLSIIGAGDTFEKEFVEMCLKGVGHMLHPIPVLPDGRSMSDASTNLACLSLLKGCLKDDDGKYIKKRQNLVMRVVMDTARIRAGPLQHAWLHTEGAAVLFGEGEEHEGAATTPEALLLEGSNIAYIALLCECCMGRNGLAQAKCQGVFSMSDLATLMENLCQSYVVKRPLLKFVRHVYLEGAAIQDELTHSTLIKIFTTDIEFAVQDRKVSTDEATYLFECLLPCIRSYFLDFIQTAAGSAEQLEMCESILARLVDLFECCKVDWQKGAVAQISRVMLRHESLFPKILSDGEWCPRTKKVQRIFAYYTDSQMPKGTVAEEDAAEVAPGVAKKGDFEVAMKAMRKDEGVLEQAELQFEEMCQAFKDIEESSVRAFESRVSLSFEELITSLINLVDCTSEHQLNLNLSLAGLKILRKCVEMENPDSTLPASEWEEEDYEDYADQIEEWQSKMDDLGCVQLIMNLVGSSEEVDIVMAAIDLGVTLLLGGNTQVQDGFYSSSLKKGAVNFFRKIDELLQQSFDEMKAIGVEAPGGMHAAIPAGSSPEKKEEEEKEGDQLVALGGEEEEEESGQKGEEEAEEEEAEEEDEEIDDGFDENQNATVIFRFMQLLAEGHNGDCQNMLQCQSAQNSSFDLVQKTLGILRLLCCDMAADLDEDRMGTACQALDTLAEVVQGPCKSAQKALMDAKVLDVCTQIMADPFDLAFEDPDHPLIMDVKEKTITLLLSLLEGVTDKTTFLLFGDRLEFDILKKRMCYVYAKCMVDADQDPSKIVDATKIPEDIYFGDLNEAFGIYMLMAKLSAHAPAAMAAINQNNYERKDRVVCEFFALNAGCIEIKWGDKLERVYYPIPPVCTFLTEASRQKFLWGVSRDSSGEKLEGIFGITDELFAEMLHLQAMSKYGWISFLSRNFEFLKDMMLNLAWLINFLLLYSCRVTTPTNAWDDIATLYANIEFSDEWVRWVVLCLGITQTILTVGVAIVVLATNGPLTVSKQWGERVAALGKLGEEEPEPEEHSMAMLLRLGPEKAGIESGEAGFGAVMMYYTISGQMLLGDGVVAIHISYFVMSLLGNAITPFMQAYHLLDVVYKSATLGDVLKAVTFNAQQLMMTGLLVMIVLYFYAVMGILLMRNHYFLGDDFTYERPCDNMFHCFVLTVREGLLNGGGMTDYLLTGDGKVIASTKSPSNYMARFFFDLSFFIAVIIVLLNIVFGIIIDTFATLREMTAAKIDDMRNMCFICSIDRYTLDKNGTPFDIHIKKEHNMWKYLNYLVYLKTKDETEYTGLESYVANMIEEEDMGFYPANKAMCLDDDEEEEDPFQVETKQKFETHVSELALMRNQLTEMKNENTSMQATAAEFNKNALTQLENLSDQQNRIVRELQDVKGGA